MRHAHFRNRLPGQAQDRLGESLWADRLGEIVQGIGLEGPDGILVVGCDKDNRRLGGEILELREQGEAILFGHLDIEKNEVRLECLHQIVCRGDILRFAHDLDLGVGFETVCEMDSGRGLVIHQNDAETPWKSRGLGVSVHGLL